MYYFAYGSNMNPLRMQARGIKYSQRLPARLNYVKLTFNKIANSRGAGYATIEPDNESYVEGALYRFPVRYLKLLDRFECYPEHYEKWIVKVRSPEKSVNAVTYIANPNHTALGLKPTKEYLNHLLAGKDLLIPDYYEKLKNTECYRVNFYGEKMVRKLNTNYHSLTDFLDNYELDFKKSKSPAA